MTGATPDTVAELQARADWHRAMAELSTRVAAMVADLQVQLAPWDIAVSAEIDAGGATITFDCPSPPWDRAHVLGSVRATPGDLPAFLQPQAEPTDVVDLAARRVMAIQAAAAQAAAAEAPDVNALEAEVRAIAEAEGEAAAIEEDAAAARQARIEDLVGRLNTLPPRLKWSRERDYQLLDAMVHGTGLGNIAAYLKVPVGALHERAADMQRLADSLGPDHLADLRDLRDAARIRAERFRA
jgi:hypothetical protein